MPTVCKWALNGAIRGAVSARSSTAPEAGWHHDGRFNLLDLITITEIEHSAEKSADEFAPYVD